MKPNIKSKPNIKPGSGRTFQRRGKWVSKPSRTVVVICECGNKYIKTRENQIICIKCIYGLKRSR